MAKMAELSCAASSILCVRSNAFSAQRNCLLVGKNVGRGVGLNEMEGRGVGLNECVGRSEYEGRADGAGVGLMVQSFSYQVIVVSWTETTSRSPSASRSTAVR